MKVGVVSDTHDNIDLARRAAEHFESSGCSMVVHCGDMVAPFTAEIFNRDFVFHGVRGNNDGEWNLQETVEEFGTFHGESGSLEASGKKIGVYHGTEERLARALVESGNYDLVFRGHTHERKSERFEGTLEINPGGIKLPGQNEEFSVAVVDLETGETEFEVFES